jgi:uncharacterized protein YneF (UPF0154 family)
MLEQIAFMVIAFCGGFFIGSFFSKKKDKQAIKSLSKPLDTKLRKSIIAKRNNVIAFKKKEKAE